MKWLNRFRGVGGDDPNKLTEFERLLFSRVVAEQHRHVSFLATKLQLLVWLESEHHFLPGRKWLLRSATEIGFEICQRELVGWQYAFPRSRDPQVMAMPLRVDSENGSIRFEFRESIERIVLEFGRERQWKSYPDPATIEVDAPGIEDQSEHWKSVIESDAGQLNDAARAILATLEANDLSVAPVLAVPGVEPQGVAGVENLGEYGQFLRFANGFNCGTLTIWGDFDSGARIAKGSGALMVGIWNNEILGYQTCGGSLGDGLQVIDAAGHATDTGKTLKELVASEVRRNMRAVDATKRKYRRGVNRK